MACGVPAGGCGAIGVSPVAGGWPATPALGGTSCPGARGAGAERSASAIELRRARRRGDRRMAVVLREAQRRILARHLYMIHLLGGRRGVLRARGGDLLLCGRRREAAGAAVITDLRPMGDGERLLIDIGQTNIAEIVGRAIVEETIAPPVAALVTGAAITMAIVHAAVKSDRGAPIARIESKGAVSPAPITRRPQQAAARRLGPGARNPVIAGIVGIGPVTWRPDIAGAGNRRLIVFGQRRRGGVDDFRAHHARLGQWGDCRKSQETHRGQHDCSDETHSSSSRLWKKTCRQVRRIELNLG